MLLGTAVQRVSVSVTAVDGVHDPPPSSERVR
jgi:hypothetical protein